MRSREAILFRTPTQVNATACSPLSVYQLSQKPYCNRG